MHGGWGGGVLALLLLALLLAAVVVGAVWLAIGLTRVAPRHGPGAPGSPEQILAERLARGEIDPDEYRVRLAALREHRPGT